MPYKHSCVIDADKNYKTLVLVLMEPDKDGAIREHIQHYALLEGEQLVDALPPPLRPYAGAKGLVRPHWDENTADWVEGATDAEIAAWEAEHPAPEKVNPPTAAEQLRADIDYIAVMTEVAL